MILHGLLQLCTLCSDRNNYDNFSVDLMLELKAAYMSKDSTQLNWSFWTYIEPKIQINSTQLAI
jgi:hypothetical protein